LVDETEKSFILLFYNKMARPARFDAASGTEFVTLGTYEDVTKKLNQIPNKLVVILFNVR
jgi:hypothetical protein